MFWYSIAQFLSFIFDLFMLAQLTDRQKDIQILLLRQQLRVLRRKARQPKHFSRFEKTVLALLVVRLWRIATDFRSQLDPILIFKPETVLQWHRELVKRKWTFKRKQIGGRPGLSVEIEQVILQLARENSRWGYDRIAGEVLKLGYQVDRSTIRNVLERHQVPHSVRK